MKTATKIRILLIIFFIIIFSVIAARYAIGLHFKKKFSKRPPPNVIVSVVEKSNFYKSIETFGTAIARNSKTFRIKKDQVLGNLKIDDRFVKKGEIIVALKDNEIIIAEFAGKLGKREIAQGVLGSDSLIITLDDLKKVYIDIKIPENYVGILKKGLIAEISSPAFKKKFRGKIESVSSRIDPSTRSILARVIVDNKNYDIIPGQLMTVKVIYDQKLQLGVPESAITSQGNSAFVYVIENQKALKKNIQIGRRNFGKVSILDGINEGDIVISEGISKVRDQSKVKIIEK
tara:strand:- start:3754 stop:4620 length:867 start_codon:yes stop_codon:yes gene_type:complete